MKGNIFSPSMVGEAHYDMKVTSPLFPRQSIARLPLLRVSSAWQYCLTIVLYNKHILMFLHKSKIKGQSELTTNQSSGRFQMFTLKCKRPQAIREDESRLTLEGYYFMVMFQLLNNIIEFCKFCHICRVRCERSSFSHKHFTTKRDQPTWISMLMQIIAISKVTCSWISFYHSHIKIEQH